MSYSQAWLDNPASIRIVLVDATAYNVLTAQEVHFYFSSTGYVTTDGTTFNPIITGTVGFQESISEDSASMSFGDIELYNLNGELDNLLDPTKYIWSNRPIKVYYGDPGWKFPLASINSTNYLILFDGVIDDIDSRNNTTVNLKVRDKLERLNTAVSENKIGTYGTWAGGQQNKDASRPIVLGEVFNMEAVLIDPATLEYMFSSDSVSQVSGITNNGKSEKLLEIRDNGVPIYNPDITQLVDGATVDHNTSTFKLTKSPAGTITCSVQGIKKTVNIAGNSITENYLNTIPNAIAILVTQFGKASTRLAVTELDLQSFSGFNNTSEIGILIEGSDNVLSICRELADSVGGYLVMGRTGVLKLVQYGTNLAGTFPVSSIDTTDILYDSLVISNRLPVKAGTTISYAKNYTIQQGLLSAIPDDHKLNFETEYYKATASNTSVANSYKLEVETPEKTTHLISKLDAEIEANRLLQLFQAQKTVYRFKGKARLLSLVLGQGVTLKHHRFGLLNGKLGQVISLSPDWLRQEIEVEVLV